LKRLVFNTKEYYVTTATPILLVVESERSFTLAKIVVNGKEYVLTVNDNGKAQMK
jgi:hypothetical protein